MDIYAPVRTFIGKLCTEGNPNSMTRHTKRWTMNALSNTRDWTSFEITDNEKGSCAFHGNFDFWTKTLTILETHDRKLKNAVKYAFQAIYPEDFSLKED